MASCSPLPSTQAAGGSPEPQHWPGALLSLCGAGQPSTSHSLPLASSYRFPLALYDVSWHVEDLVCHLWALVPVAQEGHPQGPNVALAQLYHQYVALLYRVAEAVSGRDPPCGRSPKICSLPCPRDSHSPTGEAPESLRLLQRPRESAPGLCPCPEDWQRQHKGSLRTQ